MLKIAQFLKNPWVLSITTIILVFLSVGWGYLFIDSSSDILQSDIAIYTVVGGALIFMLGVPVLIIKRFFKDSIRNFGFRLPEDKKEAVFLTIISVLLLVPFMLFFSDQASFQEYYQFKDNSLSFFLFSSVLMSFFYYLSEEFLFRGFLFFGLYKKIGNHSFWVTSVIFALLHVSKPSPEILFSFFVSFLFCYLSYKTKSFVPAFIAHFAIAVILNSLIVFG